MFTKKKKLKMILPAGKNSLIVELPFSAHEAVVGFIEASRPPASPACNPQPEDRVTVSIVSFAADDTQGLQLSWDTSGPREIEWIASSGKL